MKHTMLNYLPVVTGVLLTANALAADPRIDSWLTNYSARYARIYTTDANKAAGNSVTTWSNGTQAQALPAYTGVQEIYSSPSWVCLRSTGLGSHIMGPWLISTPRRIRHQPTPPLTA